ncbi:MAG TPA: IclR family transcriptional regulator [Candidatus Acidoferrales bacterium]|nr:IclR family transcriptional regulator [Candidatus Acidoferrales bacterium]
MNSTDKLFLILEQFTAEKPDWGVRELADATSLKPNLVHWYLKNLERHRIVRRDPETQRYELAFGLFELSQRIQRLTLIERIAKPILRRLAKSTEGTTVLRVLDGDELLCVATVDSPASLKVQFTTGTRVPINFGSVGKVVMAFLPPARLKSLLSKGSLKRFTEKTVTNPAVLAKQLAQIRARGWVSTVGEAVPGVRGIAAPVRDKTGEVCGGVGLTFPASALAESQLQKTARMVVRAANSISAQLGWKAAKRTSPHAGARTLRKLATC